MNVKKTYITLEETKYFPKTLIDYINGEPYLAPFYEYKPVTADFKKAIEDRGKAHLNRAVLVEVLKERYGKNAPDTSESTRKNIERLASGNCFTVTTGHQLCLFTGPLFFIYKIITTVNLTLELARQYPEYHFAPVYWMASEDHDFAEINHTYIFGKKLIWNPTAPPEGPVGSLSCDSLKPVIDELFTLMGDSGKNSGLQELLSEAYLNHATLSEAVFYLVDRLFNRYGLIIIDADDSRLKKEFLPVIKNELLNHTSSGLMEETNRKLKSAGIEPQVYHRELNLFYMDENGRNRIEKTENGYIVVNTGKTFSKEEIISTAHSSPEKFSPNVVLRPLYQQIILPNVCYVGGPSEVAYWLQLKEIFNYYHVSYPVIAPRCSAMIIDKPASERMKKLHIKVKDLFSDTEEIIKDFVVRNSNADTGFEDEKDKLKLVYDAIVQKTKQTDPTLVSIPEAELQKQYNALKGLETKLIRAQKQKLESSVNQLRKLKEKLFPEGQLQERHDNFIPFYLLYGRLFIDMLADNLVPLSDKFIVLEEEGTQ